MPSMEHKSFLGSVKEGWLLNVVSGKWKFVGYAKHESGKGKPNCGVTLLVSSSELPLPSTVKPLKIYRATWSERLNDINVVSKRECKGIVRWHRWEHYRKAMILINFVWALYELSSALQPCLRPSAFNQPWLRAFATKGVLNAHYPVATDLRCQVESSINMSLRNRVWFGTKASCSIPIFPE